MEKKIKFRSKWLIPLLILTAAAATLTVFVFAKYIGTAAVEGEANLQWFDVAPEIASLYESWDADTGVVEMTPAQYEKFALNVVKEGEGWAYIRILVEESWLDTSTGTVIATSSDSGLELVSGAVAKDGYLYVKNIVKDPATIPILSGSNTLPTSIDPDTTSVRLSIKVEAVQYNRVKTFWSIDVNADLSLDI